MPSHEKMQLAKTVWRLLLRDTPYAEDHEISISARLLLNKLSFHALDLLGTILMNKKGN
jgi:hypothetical protein